MLGTSTYMGGTLPGLIAGGVMGPLPERAQPMMNIAVNNSDRLVRLINDILDIEWMESGGVSMEKKVCEADTLTGQAVDVLRDMAESAAVILSVSHQQNRLWADPDRIIQTLTNLLSNALKFSPRVGRFG